MNETPPQANEWVSGHLTASAAKSIRLLFSWRPQGKDPSYILEVLPAVPDFSSSQY